MAPSATARSISLPRVSNQRGGITVIEAERDVPFAIDTALWLESWPEYPLPARREQTPTEELIAPMRGTIEVATGDGAFPHRLTAPGDALLLAPMCPRRIERVSSDAACLVLRSHPDGASRSVPPTSDGMGEPTSVGDCRLIDLPRCKFGDARATIAADQVLPFGIARAFYLYDNVPTSHRGGHALVRLQELIVCVSGSVKVIVKDGLEVREWLLASSASGLYLPGMMWRDLIDFSPGAICLVLASLPFDERDYVRDYATFAAMKRSQRSAGRG